VASRGRCYVSPFFQAFFLIINQAARHRACSRAAVRRPGRHGPWN
jgi:hypothetical protein